jgi:hypothetical protein
MPDITMCAAKSCLLKATCYRSVATPSPRWQSYDDFSDLTFYTAEHFECQHYLHVLPEESPCP